MKKKFRKKHTYPNSPLHFIFNSQFVIAWTINNYMGLTIHLLILEIDLIFREIKDLMDQKEKSVSQEMLECRVLMAEREKKVFQELQVFEWVLTSILMIL